MAKRRASADGGDDERKWGSGIPNGSRGGGRGGGGSGIPAGSRGGGMGGGGGGGIPAGSRSGGGASAGNGIPAGSRGGGGGGAGSGIPAGSKPSGGASGGSGIPAGSRGGGGGGGGSGIPAGSRGGGSGGSGSGIPAGSRGGGGGRGGSGIPSGSSVRGRKRGGSGVPSGSKSDGSVMESKAENGSGVVEVDDTKGVVEAYVSVTGIEDSVKDVIEPGAYEKTLQTRMPKGIWSHQWSEPVSKTLDIKEILPGDPSLPDQLPNGEPWPAGAGALWVKTQFNLNTDVGRRAYENVKFFSDDRDQSAWSIGYKTTKSHKDNKGTRHIKELDLYEYSPVLHGANKHAKTLSVKSLGEAMDALEMGGYDTSAITEDVKSVDATLPDPEGLTLAEIKSVVMARDILDAYLDEVGASVGYDAKRAAPVGDADLEEPDESWLDDSGHESSDAEDADDDVEVIPTLASRLEEVLDAEDYAELLDAADAFDEAVGALDDEAIEAAVEDFLAAFEAEEADDPEDVETWDELREVVATTFDEANYHVYGIVPGEGDDEPDETDGEDDPDAEYDEEIGEDPEGGDGGGGDGGGDDAGDAGDDGKALSDAEYKEISQGERDKAAKAGHALADGSYPIRSEAELHSAIRLRSQGKAPNKVVNDHIKKRARALGKTHVLPEDLRDGGRDDASENADGSKKSEPFVLPPMDWAERAALAVIPAINF